MTDQTRLKEFLAPSWATGWCPRCEFTSTCERCRYAAGIDVPATAPA